MGLRFDEKRNRWIRDEYVNGKRIRNFFRERPDEIKRGTLVDLINKFVEKTFAEKTPENRKNERGHLTEFFAFCASKDLAYGDEITLDDLTEFRKSLSVSNSTINRKMTTIRSMLTIAFENNLLPENIGKKLKALRDDSKERTPWKKVHVDQVRNHPDCQEWLKDYLLGLYLTGMRPTQLGHLKFADIDWSRGVLHTQTWKGKARKYELPIHSDFAQLVQQRFAKYGHVTDLIFVNSRGRKVTKDCLYQATNHITVKLGLNHLTPYGLRHGFGTGLAESNVHMTIISQLMGHTKLETTMRYCRPDDEHLRKALKLVRGGKAL